jgi:hypothetical protein
MSRKGQYKLISLQKMELNCLIDKNTYHSLIFVSFWNVVLSKNNLHNFILEIHIAECIWLCGPYNWYILSV